MFLESAKNFYANERVLAVVRPSYLNYKIITQVFYGLFVYLFLRPDVQVLRRSFNGYRFSLKTHHNKVWI
jgi:hypothetical protein